MTLTVFGETGFDILLSGNGSTHIRNGGAGLYGALAAARQGINVRFLTILSPEIDKYGLNVWTKMGVSFSDALKLDNYNSPKYLVSGFKAFEKKQSIPMNNVKLGINYKPTLRAECKGLLLFPIDHSFPSDLCKNAYDQGIPVFLDPKLNDKSISSAKSLIQYTTVLLVNEEEAQAITEKIDLNEVIESILEHGSQYVIIKRGHLGCILASRNEITNFPAYKSDVKCSLGSGDVFGGALAATFLLTNDISKSIKVANCVAANFIEDLQTELILNRSGVEQELLTREHLIVDDKHRKIYLAGPFFSEQELYWVNYVCNHLEKVQFTVLSPSRENGILSKDSTDEERKNIYQLDINMIDNANLLVALLDHDDPGTYFEMGYAYNRGIPIFGLKTTNKDLNNMILCGSVSISSSIEELIDTIYAYEK